MGNGLSSRERVVAFCRSRKGAVAVVSCIAVVFVFAGIFLNSQGSSKSNLVGFDCRFSSSGQAFSIEVEVELSDGMDQNEAVNVAMCALNSIQAADPEAREPYVGSSAVLGLDGLWAVTLRYTRVVKAWPGWHIRPTVLITSETFEAIIDPINRTVECSAI